MSDDVTSRRYTGSPDDLNAFADRIDEELAQSTASLPGSSTLDPALWSRIRREARVTRPKRNRRIGRRMENQRQGSVPVAGMDSLPSEPALNWPRASAAFLVVAAVLCVLVFMPGRSVEPQFGANILDAPLAVSPEAIVSQGCVVEPLTSRQVLDLVLDPGQVGWIDDRELFATPPPPVFQYPHTQTWLPEVNGAVDMAGGQRPVRTPTSAEFRDSQLALGHYLRCQEEGTNYQLWALESPVEVQRHILTLTLAAYERGWPEIQARGLEDVTETMILETIERVGPEPRTTDGYLVIHAPGDLVVEPNPTRADAFVAEDPDTGEVEYAWIATQWIDPETDEVVSTRGASLEATAALADGGLPNLVVMVLKFDPERDQWLIEWLIPTI